MSERLETQARLAIEPLHVTAGLRAQACEAIRAAIMRMDIYGQPEEIRLDERQLCRSGRQPHPYP